MKMKINYIVIPLITALTAFLGSRFTTSGIGSGWYDFIAKPSWTPDGSIIGAVWTILFILATISALIFYNKAFGGKRFNWTIAIFLLNAFLNVFWSFLFFKQHILGLATIEAGLLGVSVIALIFLIWEKEEKLLKTASLLLVPYALWVSFATYLTYAVWTLN